MAEVPPSPRRRKEGTGSDRKVAYKYPEAQGFLANLVTSHSLGELRTSGRWLGVP